MRLLNARSEEIVEFVGSAVPLYAILSHTWESDEVTLKDIGSGRYTEQEGYAKIRYTLQQALKDGLEWAWIDTCCIDKASSAELTEAINSMFNWYKNAHTCYAYMSDVSNVRDAPNEVDVAESRWFTRGWTLQELIAPTNVQFFDREWKYIASRNDMVEQLANITGISKIILGPQRPEPSLALKRHSIAQRMSWAANRITTRLEDRAYSLMGIFGVNMPLLYGEGAASFGRLQEEILRSSADLSLLAWDGTSTYVHYSDTRIQRDDLLAASPDDFMSCGDIVPTPKSSKSVLEGEATLTNLALHITAQVIPGNHDRVFSMVLKCRPGNEIGSVLTLPLLLRSPQPNIGKHTKQDVIECECFPADGRVECQDAIYAANASQVKSLAIVKRGSDIPPIHQSLSSSSRLCNYLLVRFSDPVEKKKWHTLDLYPKSYWRSKDPSFDLKAARGDLLIKQRSPIPNPDAIAYPSKRLAVYGAIALQNCEQQRIVLGFGHGEYYLDDKDVIFGVFEYETGAPFSPEKLINCRAHSLRLNDHDTVEVQLQITDVFGEKIAVMNVLVTNSAKRKV